MTEANLFAQPHMYIPFLYSVLEYLDNVVHIAEPSPQTFASKGFIHRKVKEVSSRMIENDNMNIIILTMCLDFCRNFCSKQGIFESQVSCEYSNQRPYTNALRPKYTTRLYPRKERRNSRFCGQHCPSYRSGDLPSREVY